MRRLPTKKYRVTLLSATSAEFRAVQYRVQIFLSAPPARPRVHQSLSPINHESTEERNPGRGFRRDPTAGKIRGRGRRKEWKSCTLACSFNTASLWPSDIPCIRSIGDNKWYFSDSVTPYIRSNLFTNAHFYLWIFLQFMRGIRYRYILYIIYISFYYEKHIFLNARWTIEFILRRCAHLLLYVSN